MWRLGPKIHVSWLIGLTCLCFVMGVFVAQFVPYHFFSTTWLMLGMGLLIPCFLIRRVMLLELLIVGSLTIGMWRASSDLEVRDWYQTRIGLIATVTGVISEDPTVKSGAKVFALDIHYADRHKQSGKLYATMTKDVAIKRGDSVTVKGKLSPGFGVYSASMYRAALYDWDKTRDAIVEFRDWFAGKVRSGLKEPAASLGLGFLIGEKSELPSDLVDALQIAGLTHVVVASGYNLTILVRLGRRLFMRVSKFSATLISVLLILCFIGVTGLSPSMTRAGTVALLSLAAWYYGRRFHPFVLLSFVAAISVMMQPEYVWHDVGWGLSFAAFIGVMIGAPLLQRYFFGEKKPGMLRQILGETIAAHLLTLPLIILVFSQISHVAIVSNMLVLPFVPLAMLLTFIVGLVAIFLPSIADWAGWIAEQLLDYMIGVIYYMADLSWAKSDTSVSVWWIVGMYLAIAGVLIYVWRRTKLDLRETNIVE